MAVEELSDPRLKALFGTTEPWQSRVRPGVPRPRRMPAAMLVLLGLLLAGLIVIVSLAGDSATDERRSSTAPHTEAPWEGPPPLRIPESAVPPPGGTPVIAPPLREPMKVSPPPGAALTRPVPTSAFLPPPSPFPQAPATAPPRITTGAALVVDESGAAPSPAPGPGAPPPDLALSGQSPGRMRAGALANRSTTIPQGHVIPAVLETALDSSAPGFARAIVSRDVRGFDGQNVLIPRGSRVVGEYRSEVAQGQKRASILWTRLIRPDGVTIRLNSPAVDVLGRMGVPASVNTHFFGRLGDALLLSTVDLGRALAGRAISNPVVVVPGNAAAAAASEQSAPAGSYVPTLSVPAGTSVRIFVAHDLDFGSAGAAR
jgi:type IV secretion system protein VirB10